MSSLLFKLLVGKDGGGVPLVINQSAPLFFDTFDNTDTSLTGRSGWTAAGDATRAGKIKSADGMARMKTGSNGDTPPGFQVTADLGAQNRRITFEYDFTQTSGGTLSNPATPLQYHDQRWILAWNDTDNYTYAQPHSLTVSDMQLRVYKVVAGASAEIFRYSGIPLSGRVEIELSDRIRMFHNGLIRVPYLNFTLPDCVYPDKKFPDGTDAVRAGASGFKHCFHPLAIVQSWKIDLLDTIRVSDPKPFYGHDVDNKRVIGFSGTYTGSPVSWAYRLRQSSTGDVVKDWTAFAPTGGAGAWGFDLTVSTGGPYLADFGWTGGDGFTRTCTSSPFAVGVLICCWGQSNANSQTLTGGSVPGYGKNDKIIGFNCSAAYVGSTVERYMDELTPESRAYQPSMVGLAKSLSDAIGVPVAVAAIGVGANAISTLKPGTPNWDNVLVPFVAKIGGNVRHWMWDQGEAEVLSLSDIASYPANHALLCTGLRNLGGHPDAMVFNRCIGKDTSVANNSTTITRSQAAREMMAALENGTDVWTSCSSIGVPMRDQIHYTAIGCTAIARRTGMTIAKRAYGALAYDGKGPIVTSASRASAVITLAIDLNGASGISGSSLTGYSVSNDDFSTTLTISTTEVVSNQVVITLSGTPTGTVKVRSFREPNYTETSLALGTYPDSVTIPVFPIVNPITVS